jgi:hypothetical protein
MSYSKLSNDISKSLSKDIKKDFGIFFTSQEIVDITINKIKEFFEPNILSKIDILEPSCGSGEFLKYFVDLQCNIDAYELNETIFNKVVKEFPCIQNKDFLLENFDKSYDLIVGNPPYNVIKKDLVLEIYRPFFNGRPNVFCLFILKSIELLKPQGVIAFILPENFNTSHYYKTMRSYLCRFYIDIIDLSKYKCLGTIQKCSLIIIRKTFQNTQDCFFIKCDNYYFFEKEIVDKLNILQKEGFLLPFQFTIGKNVNTKTNAISCFSYKNFHDNNSGKTPYFIIFRGYDHAYTFQARIVYLPENTVFEKHIIYYKLQTQQEIDTIMGLDIQKTSKFVELFSKNGGVTLYELKHIIPFFTK